MRVLAEALTANDHEVYTARDGGFALGGTQDHAPDVVVTDLKTPGTGRLVLLRESERRRPGPVRRFTFSTGDLVDRETHERPENSGCHGIEEALDVDRVLGRLGRVLSRRA
ncbi:MAG: hypothetical protein ACE5HU_01440 [Acidobacteriota bacterium]